ncbi:MAG: alpha/beta fold hydrolase [Nitrosomonas sp.]|nr:alpha/beta fold hydrolase [Nitrosomonas sp.]
MDAKAYYTEDNHGAYQHYDIGDYVLDGGGTINNCQLAYTTFGELNAAKDNVILVPTWFSGSHQIMAQVYVGKGRALDPEKYFIVIINQLGNGLSSSPHTQLANNFPSVQISDDVRAQHQLLTEKFAISSLALVVGGSMGAQQSYEWAVRYPDMVKRAAPIAGTAKVTPHNSIFTQAIIDSITSDPAWQDGRYAISTDVQLGLQRLAKLFTLMGWSAEFFNKERWRALGFSSMDEFITDFMIAYFAPMDANSLLCMAKKWQQSDVSHGRDGDLATVLSGIKAKVFVLSIEGDLMFPPADSEIEQQMIPGSEHHVLQTTDGHFAIFGTDAAFIEQVDGHLKTLLVM